MNEYLTINDVRKILNISQSAAYELCHRKDFPVCRFGGALRVPKQALLCWIDIHTNMNATLREAMRAS